MKKPELAFCHIQKTAGRALSGYLKSNYQESELFPFDGVHLLNQCTLNGINDYLLIMGHYPLPFLREFLNDEWRIITSLREPVDRHLSHILYSMDLAGKSDIQWSNTLDDLCGEEARWFSNYQVKYLGVTLCADEWRFLIASRQISSFHSSERWDAYPIEEAYKKAKVELSRIDALLNCSNMTACVRSLSCMFNLWPIERLPNENVGRTSTVPPIEIERIRSEFAQLNQFDSQLYKDAKASFLVEPDHERASAYSRNWCYPCKKIESPVFVGPGHNFYATGWYDVAYTDKKLPFVWSNSELPQVVYVPFPKCGYYEIEISIYIPNSKLNYRFQIEFEGLEYKSSKVYWNNDLGYISFVIDKPIVHAPCFEKVFIISNCGNQRDIMGEGLANRGYFFSD